VFPRKPPEPPKVVNIKTLTVVQLPSSQVSAGSITSKPDLVVTPKGETASKNNNMITAKPGRQDPKNYPVFAVGGETGHRNCVVSGMERRRTIKADGVETYQGALPSFRMVVTEVADIPAWHPMDSGCIISVTHRRTRNN
jgi:hypothetical protein